MIWKTRLIGILLGFAAGMIDLIPMIIQGLTWDANLSALCMWIVIGFLLVTVDLRIHSVLKGVLVAFLVLLPSAILIGWKEPFSLIPVAAMTIVLGGLLGFAIEKWSGKTERK